MCRTRRRRKLKQLFFGQFDGLANFPRKSDTLRDATAPHRTRTPLETSYGLSANWPSGQAVLGALNAGAPTFALLHVDAAL